MHQRFEPFHFLAILLACLHLVPAGAAWAGDGFGEIGANDFRITFMEGTGNPDFGASHADVVYNPNADEYLVVFSGHRACLFGGSDHEIFARRVSAGGGLVGSRRTLSQMGPTCDPDYRANDPRVAYNATDDEYLVVWSGEEENFAHLTKGEFEIFGQLLDGEGLPIGASDFRISDMGGTGNPAYDANRPDVVWNAVENQYLVVWDGYDDVNGLMPDEYEIFGQLLDSDGSHIGVNDFRISDMGGTGDDSFGGRSPSVTWNAVDNEYLVVWQGNDDQPGLDPDEREIFGQRLNRHGTAQGVNDFRISDMGATQSAATNAGVPRVTWNATANEYLVTWLGNDDEGGMVAGELETFVQRLSSGGAEVGANDVRISDMGGLGDTSYRSLTQSVVWADEIQEYLVVWWGTDNEGGLTAGEAEIFGQRLDLNASEIGANDFRISDMGGTGDNPFLAILPRVAWNGQDRQYLVVWFGGDDEAGLVEGEDEIFGQRLGDECPIFSDGFESGGVDAWSSGVGSG